jgi:hypothetical protein
MLLFLLFLSFTHIHVHVLPSQILHFNNSQVYYPLHTSSSSHPSSHLLTPSHLFFRLFQCEASREEAMFGTRIVVDIIECLSHKNMHIKRAADRATELGMLIIYLLFLILPPALLCSPLLFISEFATCLVLSCLVLSSPLFSSCHRPLLLFFSSNHLLPSLPLPSSPFTSFPHFFYHDLQCSSMIAKTMES